MPETNLDNLIAQIRKQRQDFARRRDDICGRDIPQSSAPVSIPVPKKNPVHKQRTAAAPPARYARTPARDAPEMVPKHKQLSPLRASLRITRMKIGDSEEVSNPRDEEPITLSAFNTDPEDYSIADRAARIKSILDGGARPQPPMPTHSHIQSPTKPRPTQDILPMRPQQHLPSLATLRARKQELRLELEGIEDQERKALGRSPRGTRTPTFEALTAPNTTATSLHEPLRSPKPVIPPAPTPVTPQVVTREPEPAAPAAVSPVRPTRRAQVDLGRAVECDVAVRMGVSVNKLTQATSGSVMASRFLWVSGEGLEARLLWSRGPSSKPSGGLTLQRVLRALGGSCVTSVRQDAGAYSLTLITGSRSVHLEFSSDEELDVWVTGLNRLLPIDIEK
eukprot:gnl/Dysnectes_brevis/3258_a4074_738.p1 GENE.gnl/Dysnectes_brevis/3258_a4074_738~~gnl/Dysnectes_brevis/3258_a4074_738.p1  ORF type:complete len:393 (+),score=63.33 gnl/Dysnectes_brevis/3258_a4074_738:64-1242(+)